MARHFVLWSIAIAILSFVGAAAGQTPTPGGDCCSVHAGSSCDVAACAACVCEDLEEPVCCAPGSEEGWDLICVALASSAECESACGCGTAPTPTPTPGGDCCTAHDGASCDESSCAACVCGIDAVCCEDTWDATCVSIARNVEECAAQCTTCTPLPTPPPDTTPTPGPCCEGRDFNPGCDDEICEACVCGVDAVCCSDTWDASCAVIAEEECALSCICPDDGACCDGHGGLGCDDRRCQDCVLGIDSACGDLAWDANCAAEAAVDCALECPCGDCCGPQDVAGCGDKFCQDCVCDLDEECCDPEIGWDARCESIARAECSIACPCNECCEPQPSESGIVGCGDKECQDCVCALDSNCCELEWDGICASRAADECERRCMCEPVNDCCVAGEQAGCSLTACEACVCGIDSFCCDEFWDTGCAEDLATAAECASVCQCGAVGDCAGDCNGNGVVAINELISGVRISLGEAALSSCPAFDTNGNGQVSIGELIQAVNAALDGCP
jgi:hypothetical protein